MKLKNILSYGESLDQRFWGEEEVFSPYFSTISVLMAALMGAMIGGSKYINATLDTEFDLSPIATLAWAIIIYSLNVGESIVGAKNGLTALYRSLAILASMAAGFGLGMLLAVVVLVIVSIVVVIMLFLLLIKVAVNLLINNEVGVTSSGKTVRGHWNIFGDRFHGEDGKVYKPKNRF